MQHNEMTLGGRFLLGTACLMVIIAGLKQAEALLVPLIFAAFLAILSAPPVFWLKRRRVPDVIAVLGVFVVVLVALFALAGVIGGTFNNFVDSAPKYQARLEETLGGLLEWLRGYGIDVSTNNIYKLVNPGAAVNVVGIMVSQLASILSNTFLVILTFVFLLFEVTVLPPKIRAALGDPKADLGRYATIITEVNQYVVIKTYISLAMGAAVWLLLWALGVDFSLFWGLLAFLLNYVPNIGGFIAGVPPGLLALLQFGVGRALIVTTGFVVIHTIIGNVIEPKVMGRKLGLSTFVVFLSLVVWGWLWGAIGALLSVPLTMILKLIFENSERWRWVAILMDSEVPKGALQGYFFTPPPPPSIRPPPPSKQPREDSTAPEEAAHDT